MTTSRKVGINLDLNTAFGVPRAQPKSVASKVVVPVKPAEETFSTPKPAEGKPTPPSKPIGSPQAKARRRGTYGKLNK